MTRALVLALFLLPAVCHAGPYAWGPEERLTTNTTIGETGLNHGALTLDSWGRLTAAWAEQDGPNANFRIYSRTREVNGTWNPAELAVNFHAAYAGTTLGAKFPALVTLPGDTLLMVWHDYRVAGIDNLELFTKLRAPGAAWGDSATEVRLTTSQHPESGGDNSYLPSLALAAAGSVHAVWYDYRYDGDNAEILTKSRVNGGWDLTPGDAADANVSQNAGDSNFPAVAATADGSLHVAWRDNSSGGGFRIHYKRRTPGGTWTDAAVLSPPNAAADGVTLATAPDGTVVAAWSDPREGTKAVFTRERSPAGVWGPPRRVSPSGAGAEEPALAVTPGGRRVVAWQDARISIFNRQIFVQCAEAGAAWDSTGASDVQISLGGSGKSSRPTLRADAAGRVFVLWQDARHGKEEIYFRAATDVHVGVDGAPPRPALAA